MVYGKPLDITSPPLGGFSDLRGYIDSLPDFGGTFEGVWETAVTEVPTIPAKVRINKDGSVVVKFRNIREAAAVLEWLNARIEPEGGHSPTHDKQGG